jgi:hypothetical protein
MIFREDTHKNVENQGTIQGFKGNIPLFLRPNPTQPSKPDPQKTLTGFLSSTKRYLYFVYLRVRGEGPWQHMRT